jgi:hypothetical protein
MKRLLVPAISVFLVLALLVTAFGCYGSFQLTTKVYKFNGGLGGKWVNEIGFLVMSIIPVYGAAVFVDAVILNTIEFWTGSNPMASNDPIQTINLPDGKLVLNGKDKTYEFRQIINGQEQVVRIECTNGETIARDANGTVLARSVRTADGGVNIFDAGGNLVSALSNAQVQSMIASK